MKKEDLELNKTVWLHFKETGVGQEAVISKINKKYFYVRDYLGFDMMFEIDTFEEYSPNYIPKIIVFKDKKEYDESVLVEKKRKELEFLVLFLDEDEVNFLHKKLEKRCKESV